MFPSENKCGHIFLISCTRVPLSKTVTPRGEIIRGMRATAPSI